MTLFLLIPFLIAFAFGLWVGWSANPRRGWPLVAIVQMLGSAVLVGALIVAAEAESMMARNLGLLAVLMASAALCGGLVVARRLDSGTAPRP